MARQKKSTAEKLDLEEVETPPVEAPVLQVVPEPEQLDEEVEAQTRTKFLDDDDDFATATSLSPEQREEKRLANRPAIDHLPDGIALSADGTKVPLFDVGDRIVVERFLSWAPTRWLDTRVYLVRSIDDETGEVRCLDEECNHFAMLGFKHPGQNFKIAPKRGNPFNAPKVRREAERAAKEAAQPSTGPKKRGRPKGSTNRPKEQIKAEKAAKKEERRQKKARRSSKNK